MPTAELCMSSRLNRFEANWIALFAASMLAITTACGSSSTATREVSPVSAVSVRSSGTATSRSAICEVTASPSRASAMPRR